MEVQQIDITLIKPYAKNAKQHPEEQIDKICRSIQEFGFNQPLVLDKEHVIIVGHGRFEAAQQLKMTHVPAVIADLTPEKAKAYRLADNKLNETDWEMDLVLEEIKALEEVDFDISLTGFTDADLEIFNPDSSGAAGRLDQTDTKEVECPACHHKFQA